MNAPFVKYIYKYDRRGSMVTYDCLLTSLRHWTMMSLSCDVITTWLQYRTGFSFSPSYHVETISFYFYCPGSCRLHRLGVSQAQKVSQEMSARGYALHSVCLQLFLFPYFYCRNRHLILPTIISTAALRLIVRGAIKLTGCYSDQFLRNEMFRSICVSERPIRCRWQTIDVIIHVCIVLSCSIW